MASVLITGANRGIGLELVKVYAAAGKKVIACCRDPSSAVELHETGSRHDVEVQQLRVTDGESVAALTERLAGTPIDILINNAGTLGPPDEEQSATAMDFDGWAETLAVNTMAPVRMMQALMANLELGAERKIVSITSQLGAISLDLTYVYAYSSSRAALNKFMRLAAIDLRKKGLVIGLIHPGWVRTAMGGPGADISAAESAQGIFNVVEKMTLENSGSFWKCNGELHDW